MLFGILRGDKRVACTDWRKEDKYRVSQTGRTLGAAGGIPTTSLVRALVAPGGVVGFVSYTYGWRRRRTELDSSHI